MQFESYIVERLGLVDYVNSEKVLAFSSMLNNKQIQELERQAIVAALFRLCDPSRMENFKLGDTVQLKSGGPIMTVGGKYDESRINCDWFEGPL